jgi:hypothetical protein
MAIFIKLIANYALWLYILLGLGILFFLRVIMVARREQEIAVFSLEREAAINKRYQASFAALALVLLALGVYYVSNVLVERVPMPGEAKPSATPLLFLTPTPTPAPPTLYAAPITYRYPGCTTHSYGHACCLSEPRREHHLPAQAGHSEWGGADSGQRQD